MTGPLPSPPRRRGARAFTLVELILVMGLLATLMALVAPTLSRSMRSRTLDGEAERLLALTEYARSEAASLGVPTVVWVDTANRAYGVDAKKGYPADGLRRKEYTLHPDVSFDTLENTQPGQDGHGVNLAEYAPDGTLDQSVSASAVRLADRFKGSVTLAQTADHYGYEISHAEAAR